MINKKILTTLLLLASPTLFAQENVESISAQVENKAQIMESEQNQKMEDIYKEYSKATIIRRYSFNEAKKAIYGGVADKTTFFTNCKVWPGFHPRANLHSCNLENFFTGSRKRIADKIDVMHVISPSYFYALEDGVRSCYTEKSSLGDYLIHNNCIKKDESYKRAHNDLINLVPDLSLLKRERSKKPFGMVYRVQEIYQDTGVYIGKKYFQPPQSVAGDIARIAFYMNWKYKIQYPQELINTFVQWDQVDPISEEEKQRNERILKAQGWANPYVNPELLE